MNLTSGLLSCSDIPGERMSLDADQGIMDLYRWLMQRYGIRSNKPRFNAHVSVIRNEQIANEFLWKDLHGQEIQFSFSPEVFHDQTYFWLAVAAPQLSEIRKSLGLAATKFGVTFSPDGCHAFHLTLGNMK